MNDAECQRLFVTAKPSLTGFSRMELRLFLFCNNLDKNTGHE